MWHRLAAHEATFFEEPRVFAVKFLVAVVRQHRCFGLIGDAQDETIAAADGTSRRCHKGVGLDSTLEFGHFFGVDAMTKGGVYNHRDQRRREIGAVRVDRFVELFEAWRGSAFSGQIGAVDDDVVRHNTASQASRRPCAYDRRVFTAVLWDFGGVILSSPFEAFNHYETSVGLPRDFIRSVNATNPDSNAWARLERNELSPAEFDVAFANDSRSLGHEVRGANVLALLAGEIRPAMVAALDAVKAAGFKTACLTNNVVATGAESMAINTDRSLALAAVMARFDAIVESSKVGVRKPEPRFYEIACELLDVQPSQCIFLDDLGINLKPAAAMGMHTIKVVDPATALAELSAATGLSLS